MNKKYELSDERITINNHVLHRIKALKDFSNIKAGNTGGYVESMNNLSYEDTSWIYEDARVYGRAIIYQHAHVSGNAQVFDNAHIYGAARVFGNARVYGDALVKGQARIYGDGWVGDTACVLENAWVYGNTKLFDTVILSKTVKLDSGIWNQTIKIDHKWYIVSTTL